MDLAFSCFLTTTGTSSLDRPLLEIFVQASKQMRHAGVLRHANRSFQHATICRDAVAAVRTHVIPEGLLQPAH